MFQTSPPGSCGESRLLMLQKLQNLAARIVTNSSFDASAANLIKELKWPTVQDMIRQEMATIVFKSINGLAPTYLSTLFTRNSTREIVNLLIKNIIDCQICNYQGSSARINVNIHQLTKAPANSYIEVKRKVDCVVATDDKFTLKVREQLQHFKNLFKRY